MKMLNLMPFKIYNSLSVRMTSLIDVNLVKMIVFSPTSGLDHSMIKNADNNQQKTYNDDSAKTTSNHTTSYSFQTVLELIHGSFVGCTSYSTFTNDNINDDCGDSNSPDDPTIAGIEKRLVRFNGKLLDEKQYITYEIEMVCCMFLLQSLNKALDPTSCVCRQIGIAISPEDNSEMIDDITEQFLTREGMDQLLLFLTGQAGAGKTTAIKAAEWFCYEFCSSCYIM